MKGKAEEPAERCRACKRVIKDGEGRFRAGDLSYCAECNGGKMSESLQKKQPK